MSEVMQLDILCVFLFSFLSPKVMLKKSFRDVSESFTQWKFMDATKAASNVLRKKILNRNMQKSFYDLQICISCDKCINKLN